MSAATWQLQKVREGVYSIILWERQCMDKRFSPRDPFALWLAAVLCLATLVLAPGVTTSFSSDDYIHLRNNIHFQTLGDALSVFTQPFGREYRPLVRLSLWFNHQMGDSALAYKITNLFFHLLCTGLLYALLRRLGLAFVPTMIGTLVFAIHPIHTTSIHFILGRTDLIATVFYLGCLLSVAYWRAIPSLSQLALSIVLFLLALASKELSVTLPLMVFVLRALLHPARPWPWLWREQRWLWPFGLITLTYLAGRWLMWRDMSDAISVYTHFSLANILKNYGEWAFGLLYPLDLYQAREWQLAHKGWFAISAFGICLLIAGFCAWLWRPNLAKLVRHPCMWLGLLWIFITLAPMAGGNAHRWYLYLPSAGLSVVLAIAWQMLPERRLRLAKAAFALVVLVLATETMRQSLIWKTQGELTQALLSDIRKQGIDKLDDIYLLNQPFGYRSAFLFSFNSLEEAMRVTFGQSPRVHVLSYINLDETNSLQLKTGDNTVEIRLEPTAFRYVMLSAMERYFTQPETRRLGDITLVVNSLDRAGRIREYHLIFDQPPSKPLYYFDGKGFVSLNP